MKLQKLISLPRSHRPATGADFVICVVVQKLDMMELYPPMRVGMAVASVKLIPTNGIGRYEMAVILIVEDEVFIRLFAEEIVQDMGHEPLVASDMDEVLAHL